MSNEPPMVLYVKVKGRYRAISPAIHLSVKQTSPSGFDVGISGSLELINDPDAIAMAVNRALLNSSSLYERMLAFEKSQAQNTETTNDH